MVLMDLQMPEMDGLTATRQIRQWETGRAQPRVPIIALTADAFENDRQNCLAAGMDDFLSKPVAQDALVKALRPWLTERPQRTSTQPPPTGQSLDRARFEVLVQEITPLLALNQFDAIERFKDIVQLVLNTDLAPEIAKIDITLKSFQFDLVLTQLQHLVATPTEECPP
jgi:DNA-binding response OmpR family regulator